MIIINGMNAQIELFRAVAEDDVAKTYHLGQSIELSSIKNQTGLNLLQVAAMYGSIDVTYWLLAQGLDINDNGLGNALPLPLSIAVLYNQFLYCEDILSCGANPNVLDAQNWQPLDYALSIGHIPIISLLLEHHAKQGQHYGHQTHLPGYECETTKENWLIMLTEWLNQYPGHSALGS